MLYYTNFEGDNVPFSNVRKATEFLLNHWLEDDRYKYTEQLYQTAHMQVLQVGCIRWAEQELDELGWWQVEQILDILYPEDLM